MARRQADAELRRKTVLVVDDEDDVLEIVSEMISQLGYRVKAASSGEAAQLVMSKTPVDLVICDLKMRGIDGFSLAKWVRGHFPHLPLAMMTAFPTDDVKKAVKQKLVDSLLTKPFQLNELQHMVQSLAR